MRKIILALSLACSSTALSKSGAGGGSTSAGNRDSSWGTVMAGPGLSGNEGVFARGAIGLNITHLVTVEAYSSNSVNVDSQVQAEGARLMVFPGNSFYVAGGYERRRIFRSDDWNSVFGGTSTRDVIKDRGIALSVGNRWQWTHFVMGCDWYGTFKRQHRDSSQRLSYTGTGADETIVGAEAFEGAAYFSNDTRFLQLTLGVPF